MSLLSGCQEGKGTPRLVEVKCPNCGDIGQTGTLVADEVCPCGRVLQAGSYETEYSL